MCLIIVLAAGFAAGMWFQARRSTLRAHEQITHAALEAQQASRRLADAAAETRRQMLQRSDEEPGDQ
jgi:hypothetical protein